MRIMIMMVFYQPEFILMQYLILVWMQIFMCVLYVDKGENMFPYSNNSSIKIFFLIKNH